MFKHIHFITHSDLMTAKTITECMDGTISTGYPHQMQNLPFFQGLSTQKTSNMTKSSPQQWKRTNDPELHDFIQCTQVRKIPNYWYEQTGHPDLIQTTCDIKVWTNTCQRLLTKNPGANNQWAIPAFLIWYVKQASNRFLNFILCCNCNNNVNFLFDRNAADYWSWKSQRVGNPLQRQNHCQSLPFPQIQCPSFLPI